MKYLFIIFFVFLGFGAMAQPPMVANIPDTYPFDFTSDSIYLVHSPSVAVIKKDNEYQVMYLKLYDENTQEFLLVGYPKGDVQNARDIVAIIKAQLLNEYYSDSTNIIDYNEKFVQDSIRIKNFIDFN